MADKRSPLVRQLIRFGIVGGVSTAINYAVFAVLFWFGLFYLASATIGYVVGVLVGFAMNRSWTFAKQDRVMHRFVAYVLVYAVTLALGLAILAFFVDGLGMHPLVANALVLVFTAISNFTLLKVFVFGDRSDG